VDVERDGRQGPQLAYVIGAQRVVGDENAVHHVDVQIFHPGALKNV
jgi:hypothetical protein